MTTLEFMEKELNKQKSNLARQEARKAPEADLENIRIRIGHCQPPLPAEEGACNYPVV